MTIETVISQISGGMIISTSFFIIHLLVTINKSHRSIRPIISCFAALLFAISLASWSVGLPVPDALTVVVSISISDIFLILPMAFFLVLLILMGNSLGKGKTSKMSE